MRDTPPQTASLAVTCALPAAALILVLAILAEPIVVAAVGFVGVVGVVGVSVWLADLRRHATGFLQTERRPVQS
jgi:hypothetical protein